MKFHQLQLGAVFRYHDAVWRKISPLKAVDEADGSHRLIPRSAEVGLAAEAGRAGDETLPKRLPGPQVQAALDGLVAACAQAAARLDPPLSPAQLEQLQRAFAAAARDARARLALTR